MEKFGAKYVLHQLSPFSYAIENNSQKNRLRSGIMLL